MGIQGRDQVGGANGSGTFPSCETLEESVGGRLSLPAPDLSPLVHLFPFMHLTSPPKGT